MTFLFTNVFCVWTTLEKFWSQPVDIKAWYDAQRNIVSIEYTIFVAFWLVFRLEKLRILYDVGKKGIAFYLQIYTKLYFFQNLSLGLRAGGDWHFMLEDLRPRVYS